MGFLVVLFIVVPIAELYTFVQVVQSIGFFPALLAVIAISVVGTWVVRVAGWSVMHRMQSTMRDRSAPTRELIDGFLMVSAGILMVIPGFLTGAIGLLLLLPPVRVLVRSVLVRRFGRRSSVVTATYPGSGRLRNGH